MSARTDQAFEQMTEDVYRALGVKTVINAAGTFTRYGGLPMAAEVMAAWQQAAEQTVDLLELSDRVGQAISKLVRVEAALVTSGAAGAIVLGTAAAMTRRGGLLPTQVPVSLADGYNVIRPATHVECYDHQVRSCGLNVRPVSSIDEVARSVDSRTLLMLAYNLHEPAGGIAHADWLRIAKRHQLPTLLDAAADIPPMDTLWKYTEMGYDMVAISGGKMLAGPQDAGLLLGKRALIEAAKRHAGPYEGVIGRPMKVCKEDMVAMWAAIKRYTGRDLSGLSDQWEQALATIERSMAELADVSTQRVVPPIANAFPHLLIDWDQSARNLTYRQMKEKLAAGRPSIVTERVHGTGDKGFLISVVALRPGEAQATARRLHEILNQ